MSNDAFSLSRRSVVLATAATILPTSSTLAGAINDSPSDLSKRLDQFKKVRSEATARSDIPPFKIHQTNGDEDDPELRYVGNFCKGLPQNEFGRVDPDAYKILLKALTTGKQGDFDQIPTGKLPALGSSVSASRPTMESMKALFANSPLKIVEQNGIPVIVSRERFFQTSDGFHQMMVDDSTGPQPRFYRMHSEAAVNKEGVGKLVDPQAALAFDLEGRDSHGFTINPPPSYKSKEILAEIAENYWMALCRDEPFAFYEDQSKSLIQDAVDDLNRFSTDELKVPRENGKITRKTIFRGSSKGDLVGPYVSQFLLRDIPFGGYEVKQQVKVGYPQVNGNEAVFLVTADDWYASQLGFILPKVVFNEDAKAYNYRARELCNYVHIDELFQGYLNAELILSTGPDRKGLGVPLNATNPYSTSANQTGFGTLGEPNFASLVAEVATRALKAVWYQKWSIHRRLRPEAFAGHIHFMKKQNKPYPIDPFVSELDKVLNRIETFNRDRGGNGLFLPMAFRDGCPLHPAFGAGHATVAGACVTLLKAFYKWDTKFTDLMRLDATGLKKNASIFVPPADDGKLVELNETNKTFQSYNFDELKETMTIGGELDKLASNVSLARNFSGVHWRSDHAASLKLGEDVAIEFLREYILTYHEVIEFRFPLFDGQMKTVSKF